MTGEGRHPDQVPTREAAISLPPRVVAGALRRFGSPVPIRVWIVTARQGWVELDGEALGWTATAVDVRYVDEHGRSGRAWVWANAVTRRA